jgi:hypothetical protein
MFILDAQRELGSAAFAKYRQYLEANRERFPKSAYALASSDWYFDFRNHQCPHDAWLESVKIDEPSSGDRHERRTVAITVKLLGAYHDGTIEFHYPQVYEYRLNSGPLDDGHRDWRYDELRLNDAGQVIHEIEWCGPRSTGTWIIVASDVEFKWTPHE